MWQKHVSFRPLRWSYFQFVIPGHQIFKNSDHKNPIGQIRWPIFLFFMYMLVLTEKTSIFPKCNMFWILDFSCPKMTLISIFTRMTLIPSALCRFDMQMNRVESRAAIYLPRRDPKQRDSGASAKGQPNNSTQYRFKSYFSIQILSPNSDL